MNVRTIAACTLLVLLFVALPARADVPLLVNYQGFLADDSGLPVTGSHDFTFRIYPDSTVAATPLWEETQAGIPVDGGVFTVMLGSLVAMPEDLFAGQERWLGLTLNTETEMIPRIRIVSAPYSLQAANADSAASVDWNNIANMPGGFADGVDDGGGAGDGFSLDASDGSPEDAVYVDDLGAVGVGTTSPTDLFDVRVPAGSSQGLSISHATSYNGCPTLSFNVAGQRVAKLLSHQVGQHLLIETEPGKGYIQLYPEGTFMMMVTPNGVGVNNSEPSEMLDVTGTVKATAFVGDGSGLTGLPSLTETDPTVPASIKDGIDWTELTGVPADFADGVDDIGSADGYSLDAADGGPVDVVYVDNAGAVGVGTTSPTDILDVRVPAGSSDGLSISHATSYNGYPTLSFNVAGQRVAKLFSHQVGQHLLIETEPGKGYIQLYPEGTFMMMVTPDGVGINNSEPSEMLDVDGAVKATTVKVGDLVKLAPQSSAPASPEEGDLYMDGTTHKLMCYDGTTWQACF